MDNETNERLQRLSKLKTTTRLCEFYNWTNDTNFNRIVGKLSPLLLHNTVSIVDKTKEVRRRKQVIKSFFFRQRNTELNNKH